MFLRFLISKIDTGKRMDHWQCWAISRLFIWLLKFHEISRNFSEIFNFLLFEHVKLVFNSSTCEINQNKENKHKIIAQSLAAIEAEQQDDKNIVSVGNRTNDLLIQDPAHRNQTIIFFKQLNIFKQDWGYSSREQFHENILLVQCNLYNFCRIFACF